jgi:hypothetical protein
MSLWCIENLDDAGEGMFVVDARSKEEALRAHAQKNGDMEVTSCKRIKWVDLALVTGERGESYYFERGRKIQEEGTK